jgi:L-seryl-tRNA(Ser) seleniumtransferase
MGILLGTREAVARVRRHPLYRAVRCDKLTLIAMEATLRCFLDPATLPASHPTFAMLTAALPALRARAAALAARLAQVASDPPLVIDVVDAADAVGAGSLPTVELPGVAVRLRGEGVEAGELARRLRSGPRPVFTTVHDGAVHLHVRTLQPAEEDDVVRALVAALAPEEAR